MGIVYTTPRLRNALKEDTEFIELQAKADSGATMLMLPKTVVDELQLKTIRKQKVKYANEETVVRQIVWGVEVEVCGRTGIFEAIVEPEKNYALIGAVIMESLDLIVEPRSLGIYPNPRSELPMAEIEQYGDNK